MAKISQGVQNRKSIEFAAKEKSKRLERALKAELEILVEIHSRTAQDCKEKPTEAGGGYCVPNSPSNTVFQSLVPQIEHLDSTLIDPVVNANLTHTNYLQSLSLIGKPMEHLDGYNYVDGKQTETLSKMNQNVADSIKKHLSEFPE